MRNIYALFITIGIIISSIADAFAAQVDSTRVMQSALGFFSALTDTPTERLLSEGVSIAYRACAAETAGSHAGAVCFYVINVGQKGFVMLSGDDRITPVLGYSYESSFNTKNMPENLRQWFDGKRKEISYALAMEDFSATSEVAEQWNHLSEIGSSLSVVVQPLLQTTWDQNAYYNQYCPEDLNGPNGHAYAGCVATAMAQIIRYWEWPQSGFNNHSYSCDYGSLSVDFSSANYNYNNMPNSISGNSSSTQIDAVAMLTYHCGVSVNMDYGSDGSGAYSITVPNALHRFFAYHNFGKYVDKASYSPSEWDNLIKNELNNTRPVYYSGSDEEGGHAFVCDGYDNNGNYHFNWGWSGYFNGYYALNALTPLSGPYSSGYNFSDGQEAIIGISADAAFLCCSEEAMSFYSPVGGESPAQILTIRGHSLNNSITITVESDFTISTNGNDYGFTATLSSAGGDLYVKFTPSSNGNVLRTLTLNSGSITESVSLSGNPIEVTCFPPQDLTGTNLGSSVNLSWNVPISYPNNSPAITTLSWDSTVSDYLYTVSNDVTYCMVHRFETSDLNPYHQYQLTKVSFVASPYADSYRIVVFKGGIYDGGVFTPGELVLNQVVPMGSINVIGWNTVTLGKPVMVDASQELWFGVLAYSSGNNGDAYVIRLGTNTAVDGFGNVLGLVEGDSDGTDGFGWWIPLDDGNFPIKGTVEKVSTSGIHYDVYRRNTLLGSTVNTSFVDNNPLSDTCTYIVSSVWDNSCSNGASVMVNTPFISLVLDNIFGEDSSSATCEATVTNDGVSQITACGVCWSTSPNPTLTDSHSMSVDYTDYTSNNNFYAYDGKFTSALTGISKDTIYYVRAYATNEYGTAYSEQQMYVHFDNLIDVNNIAAYFSVGALQYKNNNAFYRVPKDSQTSTIFGHSLWLGGVDDSDSLHLSAGSHSIYADIVNYTGMGACEDFWPGPLSTIDASTDSATVARWNRCFKITREEVLDFLLHYDEPGYDIPFHIASWPAHGDTIKGQAYNIAPFVDVDGDNHYDPSHGDYPSFPGDMALFFVFNDKPAKRTPLGGMPIGVEVHAMVYGYDVPQDSVLNNTLFIKYKLFNRSQTTLHEAYASLWTDWDVGNAYDDHVGCSVKNNTAYAYNASTVDGSGLPSHYGSNPPIQMLTVLGGPRIPADGLDNPSFIDTIDCGLFVFDGNNQYAITGTNFGNGIVDDERMGMTGFVSFNNDRSVVGDPQRAMEFYNLMRNRWRDGTHLVYGGNGYPQDGVNELECRFIFPGTSDPCNWGVLDTIVYGGFHYEDYGGTDGWREETVGLVGGDRRGVVNMGPFDFAAGSMQEIDYCMTTLFPTYTDTTVVTAQQLQGIDTLLHQYADNYIGKYLFVPEMNIDETICAGGQYEYCGSTYTEAGNYSVLIRDNGRDTVVRIHLTVMENPISSVLIPDMCSGGSYALTEGYSTQYTIEGPWITMTNESLFVVNPPADIAQDTVVSYYFNVQYDNTCEFDTTVFITCYAANLTLKDTVVCENELPFEWNGVTFTETGSIYDTLLAVNGCDSVVVMTLHVANSQTLATPQISVDNAAICNGGQVMLTVSNPDNNAVYTWFRNGSVIPGAVNATIIENPTTADGDPTNYVYTVKAEILASACTSSSQISPNAVVTVIPDPVVSVSVDGNTTLCEGGSASLHANVTPASGNYSYQWYKDNVLIEPATSDYHVVSEAVRETAYHYSVVVSGLPGCTATAQAPAIAFVPDPYITVTASNHISCVGGSATLTAAVECGVTNANFTYYWYKSNPNTSSPELIGMSDELTIAGNEPAGNYSYYMIAAADVYGCRTTSNIVNYTVIADPIVTITVANGYPQTVCSGGESMIKAYVAGGYGDASYQWYKNGNLLVGETYQTLELHNLAYGVNDVYTVEVSQTGAGCSSSASAAINTLVTVAPSYTIDIVGFGNVYEGSELTLNATVNGVLSGDVLAYQWYKVTNGVASAVYGATSSTCIVSGLIPGNSYEYYVTVASTISGCSCVSASVPVTVLPAPVVLPTVTTDSISNIGTDVATCSGNVTSDGGATVTVRGVCWSTSPTPTITDSHTSDSSGTGMFTSEITGLTPNTTYHVRAYATNSVGTSYGEDMSFTTHCPTIKITGPSCSFIFGNITLVASGADNYIWSTGDSSATITVAQSNTTTYSVTGTDSYGCVGTDSMLVSVYPSFNPTEVGTGLSDIEVNCNNPTVTLCANVVVNSTKDYIVESIPYNPPFGFAEGTRIFNAGGEDSWGASIHLPFMFSFYGLCYSNIYPGSNSVLTFNYPPQQCNWHYTDSIPNTNLFANTIFACYRDLNINNLGIDSGVFDTVYGEFPNRCFKLSFNNVGLYCDSSLSNTFSSMIILHEGTNIIDIYLRDAPTIVSWNNGNGVLGLQNRTGDKGITPPGRNTGPWTAHEEAWRFIPVADSNYTVTWYLGNTALSTGIIVGTGDTITVSPQESTDYTARLQYTDDCGNEFFLFQTCHVTVNKEGPIVTVNASQNELCEGDNTSLLATGADTYLWSTGNATDSITVSPTSTTTYYVTGYTGQTCSSVDSITVIVWESFDTLFNITVCDSYIWNDSVYTSSGDYVQHFQTIHGCDSTVTLHLTVNHSDATDMYATSCDSYTWNGVTYHESGDYLLYLTNAVGCDSIVTMHLTINYSDTIEFSATACNNYNWNGITYTESGDYVANMTIASGCDLVVVLHLTVNHSDTTDLYASACDSYSWNGATYYASGDYVHTFTNVAGCDSVVTLHLTINLSVHSDLFVSDCESYTWNGTTYTLSGDHVQTFTSVNGCDSVVTMHLVLNNTDALECDTTVCDIFTWNDMTYSASGDYVQTFINKNGCDSVVTLHLTVNHSCSTILQATACDIYTWNGVTYTESGDYPLYLTNAVGCDSIVTLHLTINYSDTIEFSATACNSYNWNGVTYTESGDYTTYMTNASGCNLLLVLHLTVNHSDTTNLYASACDSYFWNGTTYYVSGNYVHSFTNAAGCDSVVTLHLTISSTDHTNVMEEACDSYTWNGEVYTESGVYTQTFTNAAGCDSVVTLHLTVSNTSHTDISEEACDSYTWNGEVYTESGLYTETFTNVNGCDSVVTLHLTVNHSDTIDFYATACDSYNWNDETYTESGDYTHLMTSSTGCNLVAMLHLTINHSEITEFDISTEDSCYVWNGTTYCSSGDYIQTMQTEDGCDSLIILHLTITVGIDDHELTSSMILYPNPTDNIVNVKLSIDQMPEISDVEIQLYDMYGKFLQTVPVKDEFTSIDLSSYASGVYFVKAVVDGQVMAIRKAVRR